MWGTCCGIAKVLHRTKSECTAASRHDSNDSTKIKRRANTTTTTTAQSPPCADLQRAYDGSRTDAAEDENWGEGAEGVVVLLVDEGPMLPMMMVGVLIAKMVLVPLEPDEAPARLRLVLEEVLPLVVVVKDDASRQRLAGLTPALVLTVDEMQHQAVTIHPHQLHDHPPQVSKSQVSHVCFTSGSSGKPKGCVVSHRALVAVA